MLAISQSQLTLLSACERKFQYVFRDALSGPSSYEQQTTTEWGSQFHLLMQQRALDLPVEVMTGANAEMAASLTALAEEASDVFAHLPAYFGSQTSSQTSVETSVETSPETFSQSEHRRRLAFNGYLLTVIYDLVVCSPERGQIFDWKTHQRPPRRKWLKDDWQTRLYLYVLCETSGLRPEQISMTYWFVRLGAVPQTLSEALAAEQSVAEQSVTKQSKPERPKQDSAERRPSFYRFDYDENQHRQTQADLQQLTNRLTQLLEQADRGIDFPKVAIAKGLCDRCAFNVRCDRTSTSTPAALALAPDPYEVLRAASQLSADSVEEIPLM